MYDHTAALAAIAARDAAALDNAFDSLEQAMAFRTVVLPTLDRDACRWFWAAAMTPEQLEAALDAARSVCVSIGLAHGMQLGQDISCGYSDGLPALLVRGSAALTLLSALPAERHSLAKAFLQPVWN